MSRVIEQYKRAQQYLAGGVSASTRVNRAWAIRCSLIAPTVAGFGIHGNPYFDLCCSHGATLLGHGDARVRRAVDAALARGAACPTRRVAHRAGAAVVRNGPLWSGCASPVPAMRRLCTVCGWPAPSRVAANC